MRAFYSNIQLWPTRINPSPRTEGVSPLVRMMLHSPSADTWLPTYAWCEQQANLTTGTDGTTDSDPAQTPLLSQATWHKRKATAWFLQPIRTANPLSYTRQLKMLAKPRNHFFLDPQKTKLELSPTRRQWEDMQEYHSSINLWPSTKWPNLIRLEGGSPLVWTMLHPPATVARCLTYSWNGHLDNFVPWESNHTNGMERTPLISYARWNIQRSHDLPSPSHGVDESFGSSYGNHESVATFIQQPWQDLQQQEKLQNFVQPIISPRIPQGISQSQVAQKPNVSAPTLNSTTLAEFSTSHQLPSTYHQSAMAAAIVYCLGAQQSGSSEFAVPPVFLFTKGYQPWNYHRVLSQEPPVKS